MTCRFFHSLLETISLVGRSLTDMAVPRRCAVCGRRLQGTEKIICSRCNLRLPYTRFGARRNNPVERLFSGRFPLGAATAYMFYRKDNASDNLLISLKYRRNAAAGREFGRRMAAELIGTDFFNGVDAIVPVPLSRRRQRQRGYNQSEMIAQGVSDVTHIKIMNGALRRIVDNPTQTRMNRLERQRNVKGVFKAADSKLVSGKHFLIVDDVVTTGATVTSCADTLVAAGARRISVLALAAAGSVEKW